MTSVAAPTISVLVVDDEEGMRETLSDILAAAGYLVASAVDGESALDRMREVNYDVVVMDVRMPGRDGVSVLQEVGSPPPFVILMTAYALDERLRLAIDSGAFAVVHKPFWAPHLLELVEQAAAAA
jgi:CheY-like chemotaxis protein